MARLFDFSGKCDRTAGVGMQRQRLLTAGLIMSSAVTVTAQEPYVSYIQSLAPTVYYHLSGDPSTVTTFANQGSLGLLADGMYATGAISNTVGVLSSDLALYLNSGAVTMPGGIFATGSQAFSISFWMKPNGFGGGNYGNPFGYGYSESPSGRGVLMLQDGATGDGKMVFGLYAANVLTSTNKLTAGEWNHVGFTYDGTTAQWYINGIPDTSLAITLNSGNDLAWIGALFTDGVTIPYQGALDEFAYWTGTALSSLQMRNLSHVSRAPLIVEQPQDLTLIPGGDGDLSVTALGDRLVYQWFKDSISFLGETNAHVMFTDAHTTNEGSYQVVITNALGSVTSFVAIVTVTGVPTITQQPQSQVVESDGSRTFSVVATGFPPLQYQWFKDGASILDSTNESLNLSNVQASDAGGYRVVVTNIYGGATSEVATLTVIVNLSTPYSANVLSLSPTLYYKLNEVPYINGIAHNLGSAEAAGDGIYKTGGTATILGSQGQDRAINCTGGAVLIPAGILSTGSQPFSVSFWIKPTGFGLGNYACPFSYGGPIQFGRSILINLNGDVGDGSVQLGTYGGGILNSVSTLTAGAWNHVGLTYDGTNAQLYLNGIADNSIEYALNSENNTAWIGALFTDGISLPFEGGMDEFAYWISTALSSNEMMMLATQPCGSSTSISGSSISITSSGSTVTLSWSREGTLESSTNLIGPYSEVLGATSPFDVSPAGPQRFYRVRHYANGPASVFPSAEEMCLTRKWAAAKLNGNINAVHQTAGLATIDSGDPPFSFIFAGQPSDELLRTWNVDRLTEELDNNRNRHTSTYTDPKTGLVVRCVAVEYNDYPIVEWTVFFKNTGITNTPILERILALDMRLRQDHLTEGSEFVLYHNVGSQTSPRDYAPLETVLTASATKTISAAGGRPSNSDLPYFNLRSGNQGMIIVVGWPGQWSAKFTRDLTDGVSVVAGQELTHFQLHPGEEVRTPLMVLQFWRGDRYRSQNIWRRWMLAHNVPRPGGKPIEPMTGGFDGYYYHELLITEEGQKRSIDRYAEEGIHLDYWWIDAGWYVNNGTWMNTGTWEVDQTRFPNGLRTVTDHARSNGIAKSILWFEPERATWPSWIHTNHPNWLLGPSTGWQLVYLGDTNAQDWATEQISKVLREECFDAYRQDFNMDPLPLWRANDAANRQGITENKHVTGYLAFWDALLRRHPEMLIDTCASGGKRNDLETLRRAVPLWRSDWAYHPQSMQCLTYGISSWIPYYGTGVGHASGSELTTYTLYSDVAPFVLWAWDMNRTDLDFDLLRAWMAQWRQIAPSYLGDYYPLTSYSTEEDVWMAWQFDRPEAGEGIVQVFRRAENSDDFACFKLHALDADAQYVVRSLDASDTVSYRGSELLGAGLPVTISNRPTAVIFRYERVE